MQSLAHETNAGLNRECGRLPNAVLGLPLEMRSVNTKRCTGCTNAVPMCGCLQGSPCRTQKWAPMQANTMVGGAACRAAPATCAMILAHMVMDGEMGRCKQGLAGMGSRLRQADKAWQGKAGTGCCSKNRLAGEAGRPLVSFNEVRGGSAVVPATRKAGSDLPYCLPPNLSPLPVSVHTHSLSLPKI